MSHYLAGGLMLLLLSAAALLGLEAYGLYDSVRMVDTALLEAHPLLVRDGGLSPGVERAIRRRLQSEGGRPDRIELHGSRPGTPWGMEVRLDVTYHRPYALTMLVPGGDGWRTGTFRIRRSLTALSRWQP